MAMQGLAPSPLATREPSLYYLHYTNRQIAQHKGCEHVDRGKAPADTILGPLQTRLAGLATLLVVSYL